MLSINLYDSRLSKFSIHYNYVDEGPAREIFLSFTIKFLKLTINKMYGNWLAKVILAWMIVRFNWLEKIGVFRVFSYLMSKR